jgi:superfamily I DNA and RNA helicase
LNVDQQQVFDVVSKGHNAFVTGDAGAGKTFLLAHIYNFFKSSKKNFVTCMTGIACKNLPSYLQPTTVHSFAGIKECKGSSYSLLEQVKRNSDAVEQWKNADVEKCHSPPQRLPRRIIMVTHYSLRGHN